MRAVQFDWLEVTDVEEVTAQGWLSVTLSDYNGGEIVAKVFGLYNSEATWIEYGDEMEQLEVATIGAIEVEEDGMCYVMSYKGVAAITLMPFKLTYHQCKTINEILQDAAVDRWLMS